MAMERINRDLKNIFSFSPVGFSGEESKLHSLILFIDTIGLMQMRRRSRTCFGYRRIIYPLPLITKMTYEHNQSEEKLSRLEEVYAYPNLEE